MLRHSGNDFLSGVVGAHQTLTVTSRSMPDDAPAIPWVRITRDTTTLVVEPTGAEAAINFLSGDMPVGALVFLRVRFNPIAWMTDGDSQGELPGESMHVFVVNDAAVWERVGVDPL